MSLSKTTKKRLLVVVCCGALLVGGGLGAYAVRKHRVRVQYAAYRADGLQAAKAADNAKAVELLGTYLRRYPEDVEALVEYARVRPLVKAPDRQHLRDTMVVLRHLLTLRPDMAEQRRTLLRMYADYGYAAEAVATADKLLEATPDDAEILGIKATSLARMRRLGEALTVAQKWAEKAPQDIDAHLLCIQMMQANGRSRGEIDKVVEGLRGKLKDEASVELVRGIAAAVTGSPKDAFDWIQKVAARPTLDAKVLRRVAGAFDSLGKPQESLAALRRLVKETPDADAQRTLVRRLWELNQWAEVLSYPIPPGSELASDLEVKGMIGSALIGTGKTEQAKAIAAELSAAKQDAVAVAWGEVLGQALSVIPAAPRKVVEACEAGLKDAPGDAYLRYFLGQANAQVGETDLAVANYQKAAQQSVTWATPLVALSEAYLGMGRSEQALGAAGAAFQRSPGMSAVVLAMALNANIEAGNRADEAGLQQLLTEIEKVPDGARLVLPERVASLARTGKKADATDAIKKALAATPAPAPAVLNRLAAASRTYKLGMEGACYDALGRGGQASATLALSKALAVYLDGKKDEALAQVATARRAAADSREWAVASARLLDVARDPKASSAWIALADGSPDDLSVQQLALSARSVRGEREFIDRTIERVKRLSGNDGVQWRVARARWLLDGVANQTSTAERRKTAEDASVLLSDVVRVAPDAVEARFLQARALEVQGNTSAAAEQMTAVVQANPSMVSASLYLAQLLQSRGDFIKAREYLERVTQSGLKDASSRRLAAQLLAQQGNPGQGIKVLEDATDAGGGSDLLLAMLYRQQNDLKHAEEIVGRLLQKPDLQTIMLAVDLYGAMGRPDDAKRAVALIDRLKVEPGVKELLLVEYAAKYGKMEDAIALSRAATARAPQNALTWRALIVSNLAAGKLADAGAALDAGLKAVPNDTYLRAVADVRPLVSTAMADAGLRSLAVALARSPETSGTRDALEVMATPVSPSYPKSKQLTRLKQVADQFPLNLTLQLFAAERFLSAGDRFEEAAAIATRAVQSFPLSADATRLAASALLSGRRWAEAVAFARAWRERTPNNPGEADFVAALALLKSDRAAEAKAQLAPDVPQALEQPDRGAEVIALYAAALHKSGARDEAKEVLLPALQKSEAVRAAWIARAVEDLSVADAVDWVGRVSALSSDNSLAGQVQLAAASTALGQKAGNNQLLATARELRTKMAARTDLSVQALAVLASQAEQDKDLASAEALYRRALAADGSLALVKNNLAMVLAHRGEKLAEAEKLASEAVQSNPGVATFYDTLAQVQFTAGDPRKAAETLRHAASIDPDHLEWQVGLFEMLVNGGQIKEAAKALDDLEKALRTRRQVSDELRAKIAAAKKKFQDAGGQLASTHNG
jgi:lipopolysaccharide biosynthesis regulator YciM